MKENANELLIMHPLRNTRTLKLQSSFTQILVLLMFIFFTNTPLYLHFFLEQYKLKTMSHT